MNVAPWVPYLSKCHPVGIKVDEGDVSCSYCLYVRHTYVSVSKVRIHAFPFVVFIHAERYHLLRYGLGFQQFSQKLQWEIEASRPVDRTVL